MEWEELLGLEQKEKANFKPIRVHCCTSTGCRSTNSMEVKNKLETAVKKAGLQEEVQVVGVGCMGFCGRGPMIQIDPEDKIYEEVKPEEAESIIAKLPPYKGGLTGDQFHPMEGDSQHPFFARQLLIVREKSGKIDPNSIEEYIAVGGYQQLHKVLYEMTPVEVINEIKISGLRGRGGAGYPTGLKWETVAKMPGEQKYVVCNGDEGDPGAFMDRSVLESDPHTIIEAMAIAGYAVGATQGFIYVRAEYPLAVSILQKAIQQAKKYGFLGSQIFNSSFDFKIDIRIGAGAFVCGEETALIASVEGKRGTPRPRPPFPAQSGLWECPTLINNVETLGNIPPIIREGGKWFAGIGTAESKGTKIFALTGKVQNTGLIEVPMGITLRDIVEEMGGGVPDGGTVKAVQTGGPSGGCIPADAFDTPVSYESLVKLGTMMGSGGMIVMDTETNMIDVAHYYMEFCRGESCGKCIPCRAGTVQMYQMLTKILKGEATESDIENLEALCHMVKSTSLCGLGQSAPNPVLSTLRYFRNEYDELLVSANGKVQV